MLPDRIVKTGTVSREDVRGLAVAARTGRAAPTTFLLAAMAWGYGDAGYGPWRTAVMLASAHAEERVLDVLRLTHSDGAVPAYLALAGPCRLPHLGASFATKVLYFAGQDSQVLGPRALILDSSVGRALASYGVSLKWWTWSAGDYGEYLEIAHELAGTAGAAPEDVECRLFDLGRQKEPASGSGECRKQPLGSLQPRVPR